MSHRLLESGGHMHRLAVLTTILALSLFADDGSHLLTVDHYVKVKSTVPAMKDGAAQIYVREVVLASTALRDSALTNRVALFIHGAGTPAEVAFDVPYQDYSWM